MRRSGGKNMATMKSNPPVLPLSETLVGLELDPGESVIVELSGGQRRKITLVSAGVAGVIRGCLPYDAQREGIIRYRFKCDLEIDGVLVQLTRNVPSQENFRDPPTVMGLHVWLDATADICQYLGQHGTGNRCVPQKACRLAIWPAGARICPPLLHPWCPLPSGNLQVTDCYRGEDVWMGPYDGTECHGGLDINHPAGTPLWTPFAIHEHEEFNRVGLNGANNNRWRGWHHWKDGSSWFIQSHHHIRLLVSTDAPLDAGTHYAEAAGVLSGAHEHSHFVFGIRRDNHDILLDPWLLFRQMYLDRQWTTFKF